MVRVDRRALAILAMTAAACGDADVERSHGTVEGVACEPIATPHFEPDPTTWDVSWLWSQLERDLDDRMTPAEKAETIARFVALSSVNDREIAADQAAGERLRAIPFYGLCGERSVVTKQLARRAGLRAEVFNLYNFIEPGSGHTTVQFCYDDDWHFFDVTYAGMFVDAGDVLAFDRIRVDPWRALSGLVGYETGFDLYQSEDGPGDRHTYDERLRKFYSPQTIQSTPSLSFLGAGVPVPLVVRFDLARAPIVVGRPGALPEEVHWAGADQGISERMGVMLGHLVEKFQPRLVFENAVPGQRYAVRFDLRRATSANLELELLPIDVELETPSKLVTSEAMVAYPDPEEAIDPFQLIERRRPESIPLDDPPGPVDPVGPPTERTWTIRFRAHRSTAGLAIRHDLPFGEGAIVERVVVTPIRD